MVATGIYYEALTINTNNLKIVGVNRASVIIDATGKATNSSGIYVNADNVSLESLTLISDGTNPVPRYGIKFGLVDGCSLVDVTVQDIFRSGIDALGTSDLTINNVSSLNNGGHGLSLVDCNGVGVSDITTDGNGWQAVSVATWGRYSPLGTSGIVFSGTNSFGTVIQIEEGDYNNPGVPPSGNAIITYSTNPGDGADLTLSSGDFAYALHGEQDDSPDQSRVLFFPPGSLPLLETVVAAMPLGHMTGNGVFIEDIVTTTQYYLFPGCTIQAAIDAASSGDYINVAAGNYVEALLIQKPLFILGATHGVNKNGYVVPANYAWDPAVESIITHPDPSGGYLAIVDIDDTDNVTFDGFVVGELNAVANANTSLIRVRAQTGAISGIKVENCVIGPNTNFASQDGAQGRMGLYLVNNPYNDFGIENSSFSHNKIFDAKGNGNNVFLWSSYFAYGAAGPADMTGTVISDNEIYGSHRSGLETAGGFANLTISNNEIYGQSGLSGDVPNQLKYGHGILMIRGASDKISDPLTAYGPSDLIIIGNNIYGNEKSGIYMGPKNDGIILTDNVIHDNGWNGVMVDLVGNFWNPTFENPQPNGQYACYDCTTDLSASGNQIYGNGTGGNPIADYGMTVNGVPTNGFEFAATGNWWGHASGPLDDIDDGHYNPLGQGDHVSSYVDYDPWTGKAGGSMDPETTGPLNCSQTITLTFNYTADDYTPDMFLYNAVVSATAGLDFGAVVDLYPFGHSNNNFFAMSTGANQWTITGSTVGSPTYPVSGPGTTGLFTIIFSATSDVVGSVVFDSLTLRDPDNNTIPVDLNGATITFDCTAPLAVTNITATPHHNRVGVSWAHDGTDVDHYEVFSGMWHDGFHATVYPEYDDVVDNTTPTRPGDYPAMIADILNEWDGLGNVTALATDQTWDPSERGVYYYEVYAVDAAGNPSPRADANDRATNYWLGDTDESGTVVVNDISTLGAAFGTTDGVELEYNAFCDVGPTDNWSRVGVPTTDDKINFEDLMVFSMNFGVVSGTNKSDAVISSSADLSWVRYDEGTYALRMNDATGLKGVHLRAALSQGAMFTVTAGSLLDQQSEMTFLQNIGKGLDVNLAITGVDNGFTGHGDLFIVESSVELTMDDIVLDLRGSDNSSMEVDFSNDSGTLTPRVFALNDAFPNPFNPMTKISFSLPEAQNVRLNVYGVDGKLVATLVNETRAAGLHEIIWNGQNDAGQVQASGLYFYRIEAGPYSQVRKMTLMK